MNTKPRWDVNANGDLVNVSDSAFRTVAVYADSFPLSATKVAALMHEAFLYGASEKARQIREALGA
jgi:hypothetical protein